MDFVWSPWRYTYVSSIPDPGRCVFCIGEDRDLDTQRLVIHRGRLNFVIMNMFPYTSGHLMVAPYRHVGQITQTEPDETDEMMALSRRAVAVLSELYHPEGFNIGINLGACAGAGVRHHLHQHVVPRWCGDVNFMTALGETRVLPEDLESTYQKLKPFF